MTTRSAAPKRNRRDDDDAFDLSRARVIRRGPRRDRPLRITVRSLRVAVGKTQYEVSEVAGIAQPDVSKIEHKDDDDLRELVISTVGRFVEALGGRLELVAVFPKTGHRFEIVGHEGDDNGKGKR